MKLFFMKRTKVSPKVNPNVNPRGGNGSIPVSNIRMSPDMIVYSSSEIKVYEIVLMYAPNLKI